MSEHTVITGVSYERNGVVIFDGRATNVDVAGQLATSTELPLSERVKNTAGDMIQSTSESASNFFACLQLAYLINSNDFDGAFASLELTHLINLVRNSQPALPDALSSQAKMLMGNLGLTTEERAAFMTLLINTKSDDPNIRQYMRGLATAKEFANYNFSFSLAQDLQRFPDFAEIIAKVHAVTGLNVRDNNRLMQLYLAIESETHDLTNEAMLAHLKAFDKRVLTFHLELMRYSEVLSVESQKTLLIVVEKDSEKLGFLVRILESLQVWGMLNDKVIEKLFGQIEIHQQEDQLKAVLGLVNDEEFLKLEKGGDAQWDFLFAGVESRESNLHAAGRRMSGFMNMFSAGERKQQVLEVEATGLKTPEVVNHDNGDDASRVFSLAAVAAVFSRRGSLELVYSKSGENSEVNSPIVPMQQQG